MASQFKNIDQIVRETMQGSLEKAPAFVKTNLNKRIDSNKSGYFLTLIGSFSIALTAIVAYAFITKSQNLEAGKDFESHQNTATLSQKNNNKSNDFLTPFNKTEIIESANSFLSKNFSLKENNALATSTQFLNQPFQEWPIHEIVPSSGSNNNELKPKVEFIKHSHYNAPTLIENKTEEHKNEVSNSSQNVKVFGLNYPEIEISETPQKYSYWFATLESGINFTKPYYTSNNTSQEDIYDKGITRKLSTETLLDFTWRSKSALTLSIGAGFTQFNEYYNYISNSKIIDSAVVWNASLGTYEMLYDTAYSEIYNFKGQNNSNYGLVQVGLGTQIDIHKFKLDLFAKGRFNYLINANGGYIKENELITYERKDNVMRKAFLNLALGARLHYPLSDQFFINASMRYTPVFGELTHNTPFSKKMQYSHVGIGISYIF